MHILVTNDDGVTAPGLLALAQAMRHFGDVSVLAPDRDWSGAGHVKTFKRPLRVRDVKLSDETPALTNDGAPSDCVALALLGILPEKVDLIVSGINTGANLGHDVTYSGTVTAVMEGIIMGVPGVAVSMDGAGLHRSELDYTSAVDVASWVVKKLITEGIPENTFLNVNVPYVNGGELKGILLTQQGLRVYHGRLDKRQDPRGKDYYWIAGDHPTGVPKEGTDVEALAAGYASVTPLQLDLTDYKAISTLSAWFWPDDIAEILPGYGPEPSLTSTLP